MTDADKLKQPNSRHCFVCGLENPVGLQLHIYQVEAGVIETTFTAPEHFQGYPGVLHGGIIATILDEISGRAHMGDPSQPRFMFTGKLEVIYRKNAPVGKPLRIVGKAGKTRGRTAEGWAGMYAEDGALLAEATTLLFDVPREMMAAADLEMLGWKIYPDKTAVTRPLSIENRWDILYRDYPEVYDAFSKTPYHPDIHDELPKLIALRERSVADVGSGSGASSFALARFARRVIGVELEPAMQRVAQLQVRPADPISFVAGDALALPLADASVDLVIGVTLALYPPEQYRGFIREGLRAARQQVVYAGIPPGWYGGDVGRAVGLQDEDLALVDRIFVEEFNFACQDIDSLQEYGSVEHIVNTYGFIFGRRAIDYLIQAKKTSILWKFRVYMRQVA